MSKTIFISGNFNILHPGHLRLMRFARELGDELIVGVYSDSLGGEAVHVPRRDAFRGRSIKYMGYQSSANRQHQMMPST